MAPALGTERTDAAALLGAARAFDAVRQPGPFCCLGPARGRPDRLGDHAGLLLFAGSWFVVDRSSTNGTFVNESRVPEVATVHPGDMLGLGSVTYRLTAPRPDVARRMRVTRALGMSR